MLKTRTGNLPITDKKMQSFLSPSSVLDHWIPKFFCIKFQKNIIYEREFEDAILHIITSCKLMYVIIHSYFFPVALRPNAGHGILILEVSRSHTTTHHSRQDSSGRVISLSQRPLLDNTQHSQQTNIHALGGIRIHDLSRRAAADLRLRPLGHWDRLLYIYVAILFIKT